MKRTCKICNKEKEYNYFILNTQGRATYKDEDGYIWHSRVCYECFKGYVKKTSGKPPLLLIICPKCSKEFKQKNARHKVCNKLCQSS